MSIVPPTPPPTAAQTTSNGGEVFLSPRLTTPENHEESGSLTSLQTPNADGAFRASEQATAGTAPQSGPPTGPPTPGAGDRPRTTETIAVPAAAAEGGEYVLRMRGDSMVDAGMLDGDYLVVRSADTATDGQIVVALVGDAEATVKRWRVDPDGSPWLEPANFALLPIRGVDVRVVGRVVGLFRSVSAPSLVEQA